MCGKNILTLISGRDILSTSRFGRFVFGTSRVNATDLVDSQRYAEENIICDYQESNPRYLLLC
jgi:hypothetical protein